MIEISWEQAKRVLGNLEAVLEAMGAVAVSYSQRSFETQSFGGKPWPPRYPFQSGPKVNVAGVIRDYNEGRQPPARRFQDTPALIDTGDLRRSITAKVISEDVIEVGADPAVAPYANTQQQGGPSVQQISRKAKLGILSLISQKPELTQTLRPLFKKGFHITEVIGRQFIGVTAELEEDLAAIVEEEVARA